ncbi:MAG: hypothetical protein FWC27_13800 [Firmicutes bacterium]|nr:hypothetical protein [Bacillota bacterium]
MEASFFKKAIDPFQYLFWKWQISILRGCPPLVSLMAKVTMGIPYSSKAWAGTFFRFAVQAPRAIHLHCQDQYERRVVLSRVVIPITTRCTLNCDKCVARIPDIAGHADIPLHELVSNIRVLLSCVDLIYVFSLSGGEPFLHPDLDKIIWACANSGKINEFSVQTNGTIIPEANVLVALREAKASVRISKYTPTLQPNVEKLKDILEESGIRYMYGNDESWCDKAGLGQLQAGSAQRRFGLCAEPMCMVYMDKKLHLCAESAVLAKEQLITDHTDDYIDLRNSDPDTFAEQLHGLLHKRVISACSYCLGNTYKTPKVPPAVQRQSYAAKFQGSDMS